MARTIGAQSITGKSVIKETTSYEPVVEPVMSASSMSQAPPADAIVGQGLQRDAAKRDSGFEPEFFLQKVSDLIWLILGVAIAFIALRVVLKLIAADPENEFARFVLDVTTPLVSPFVDLAPIPSAGMLVFETYSVVAMMVYALAGWILVRLTWLIFEHPSSSRYREERGKD
jgi:hypothetical protein